MEDKRGLALEDIPTYPGEESSNLSTLPEFLRPLD